jgi:hypothetical protein
MEEPVGWAAWGKTSRAVLWGGAGNVLRGPRQLFTRQLIFKSWKSYLHLAMLPTKTKESTLCSLYGRLLLILLTYALCPSLRATVWANKRRELSLLKLVRHLQAGADRWLQALFQPAAALRRFLHQTCATAARLVAKASRKRRTTAQLLRDSLDTQNDCNEFPLALAA